MRAYIDADILIWHLRGKNKARIFIRTMQESKEYELWIGAMQRAEVVFFMRPTEEKMTILFLSLFNTAPADQEIIDTAGILYRKWHPSHGVDIHDAILAATVMQTGGKIYTINQKHYPMPDIIVQQPW